VARELIDKVLVRRSPGGTVAGTIVEAEAYSGIDDPGSHAYRGRRTARNEVLYGNPGHAYVYMVYGMHHCLNVVCSGEGDPQGAFIRAVRPTVGIDIMAARRGIQATDEASLKRLCNGPSRLCVAFAIDRSMNGTDLTCSDLYIIEAEGYGPVEAASRVGIDYAGTAKEWPWRFLSNGDPNMSHKP
jgi:DNA-3-methyladenine glycosylase